MMMEAIYSGNFRPSETCVDDIPGSWELGKEVGELRDELKQRLDMEDYLLVDQLTEKLFEQHSLECQSHFCSGFAAGLLLVQEAQPLGEKLTIPQ